MSYTQHSHQSFTSNNQLTDFKDFIRIRIQSINWFLCVCLTFLFPENRTHFNESSNIIIIIKLKLCSYIVTYPPINNSNFLSILFFPRRNLFMYKLFEWISVLTMSTDAYSLNSDMATNYHAINNTYSIVNKKRHIKYFQRCLDVLPPRLASHDSTR